MKDPYPINHEARTIPEGLSLSKAYTKHQAWLKAFDNQDDIKTSLRYFGKRLVMTGDYQ